MQYALIAILSASTMLTKDKKIQNPVFLFSLIWLAIIVISSIGANGMEIPSQETFLLLFIGCLGFIIGYCFKISSKNKIKKNMFEQYEIKYSLIVIFELLSIIVLLPQAITSAKLLMQGYKLGTIHTIFITEDYSKFYSSRSYDIFFYLFVYPTLFTGVIIAAYDFWFGKRNVFLQIMTFALVFTRLIQFGGRAPVFYLVFAYLIGLFMYLNTIYGKGKEHKREARTFLKKMLPVFIIMGVVLIFAVFSRLGNAGDFVDMIIEYFAGCPIILSKKLESLDLSGGYTFGLFTLFGFYNFAYKMVSTAFKAIGIAYASPLFDLLFSRAVFVEEAVNIGSGVSNAFVSPFFYFYCDGWYVGAAIFSFVWGMISSLVYSEYKQEMNVKNAFFLIYILFTIGFSMMGCLLSSTQTAMAILMYFVFIKRERKIKEVA